MNDVCDQHSGCLADIRNIKAENREQWKRMATLEKRNNAILSRLNVVLGGIVVACVMLVINIFIK